MMDTMNVVMQVPLLVLRWRLRAFRWASAIGHGSHCSSSAGVHELGAVDAAVLRPSSKDGLHVASSAR